MERDEFEYRLKELVVKIDCRIAADALLEEAKRQYLRYAAEAARAQFKHGHELGVAGKEPF